MTVATSHQSKDVAIPYLHDPTSTQKNWVAGAPMCTPGAQTWQISPNRATSHATAVSSSTSQRSGAAQKGLSCPEKKNKNK